MADPYLNTIIYTEFVLKVMAMGFINGKNAYMKDPWNCLDCFVVLSSLANSISLIISPGSKGKSLSAFRSIRLLRPLKLLSKIPSLKVLVTTLFGSIMGLSGIGGLAFFFFSMFSILGITVWNGRIHYRCYMTEFPENGEWLADPNYPHLCSSSSPCP